MNFDSLPSDKPAGFVVPKGTYKAKISDATIRNPKDTSKAPYLGFKLDLSDKDGNKVGTIFDNLFDSDRPLLMFKMKRFLLATGLKLQKFELADLAKVINNKEVIVDVCDENSKTATNTQPKSVVDVLKNQIYYPLSEASAIFGDTIANTSEEISATDSMPESLNAVDEVF